MDKCILGIRAFWAVKQSTRNRHARNNDVRIMCHSVFISGGTIKASVKMDASITVTSHTMTSYKRRDFSNQRNWIVLSGLFRLTSKHSDICASLHECIFCIKQVLKIPGCTNGANYMTISRERTRQASRGWERRRCHRVTRFYLLIHLNSTSKSWYGQSWLQMADNII